MRGSRKYSLNDLKPGMVLARTVFSDDGRNIIGKRTVLTKQKISLLHSWDVLAVEILDMNGPPGKELSYPQFANVHVAILSTLTQTFIKARLLKTLPAAEMDELAQQAEKIVQDETAVLGHLAMIHNTDGYIFKHSVNVGIIAGLIGKWIGYTGTKLKELILAGFLHDIGKTQIPLPILNKPNKLSSCEWQVIKQHPVLGFELLQSPAPPTEDVLSGVYQHHERVDGRGYPRGLSGPQISLVAKIIAIADIYDAMTSDRSYRNAETPFQAIEEIHRQMFGKLDPELCNIFISKARESFIGMEVQLSDGSEATVMAIDQTTIAKPILRKKTGCYTNLAQSNLTIIAVEPSEDH